MRGPFSCPLAGCWGQGQAGIAVGQPAASGRPLPGPRAAYGVLPRCLKGTSGPRFQLKECGAVWAMAVRRHPSFMPHSLSAAVIRGVSGLYTPFAGSARYAMPALVRLGPQCAQAAAMPAQCPHESCPAVSRPPVSEPCGCCRCRVKRKTADNQSLSAVFIV